MSVNDSLFAAAAVVRDAAISVADPSVQAAAKAVSQEAVAAAVDVIGKGGFGAKATLGQLVEFQLTGLFVVFTVLGGLTLLCYLLAWILKTVAPNQYFVRPSAEAVAKPTPPAKPIAPALAPGEPSIHPGLTDEELIVILVAAASEAMGRAVSIVSFRPMDSMDWRWSLQGRVDLHSSHQR